MIWPFAKKKVEVPLPPPAIKNGKASLASKVHVHAQQLALITAIPQQAQSIAASLLAMDGLASLAGWRFSLSGGGDAWTLHMTTHEGIEHSTESDGVFSVLNYFAKKWGFEELMKAVERAKDEARE